MPAGPPNRRTWSTKSFRGKRAGIGKWRLAGRQANAAVHWRQQIAEIGVENGMIEHGIAARLEMQMIAAFDGERDRIAERREDLIGPRSHRDNDVARRDRAFERRHAPTSAGLLERSCIADQIPPALVAEQRRIGFGQTAGIWNTSGRGKM